MGFVHCSAVGANARQPDVRGYLACLVRHFVFVVGHAGASVSECRTHHGQLRQYRRIRDKKKGPRGPLVSSDRTIKSGCRYHAAELKLTDSRSSEKRLRTLPRRASSCLRSVILVNSRRDRSMSSIALSAFFSTFSPRFTRSAYSLSAFLRRLSSWL